MSNLLTYDKYQQLKNNKDTFEKVSNFSGGCTSSLYNSKTGKLVAFYEVYGSESYGEQVK